MPSGVASPNACASRSKSPASRRARRARRGCRIDVDRFHRRQVDQEAAVAHRGAGDVVAAAAHGEQQICRARTLPRARRRRRRSAHDRRTPVDHRVPDRAGGVVTLLSGQGRNSAQLAFEGNKPFPGVSSLVASSVRMIRSVMFASIWRSIGLPCERLISPRRFHSPLVRARPARYFTPSYLGLCMRNQHRPTASWPPVRLSNGRCSPHRRLGLAASSMWCRVTLWRIPRLRSVCFSSTTRSAGRSLTSMHPVDPGHARQQLQSVLPGGDGRGGPWRAVDPASLAGTRFRIDPFQRFEARRAADVSGPTVEAA